MTRAKLRKSRLLAVLVGIAWLPYVTICCVVTQVADASSTAHCPMMARAAQAMPDVVASPLSHGMHHASDQGGAEPVQTCCDLKTKTRVTPEKTFDLTVPAPVAVASVVIVATAPSGSPRMPVQLRLSRHEHGPPIYLTNSSFLI
jgi:hypothetical protein